MPEFRKDAIGCGKEQRPIDAEQRRVSGQRLVGIFGVIADIADFSQLRNIAHKQQGGDHHTSGDGDHHVK